MRHATACILLVALLSLAGCATLGGGHLAAPQPRAEVGTASFYAHQHHGRKTASGRVYHEDDMTAAHRTLPFGTRVRVTNLRNDRSVVLTINDRGPYARGRIIDVSRRAARELGFLAAGTARVRVEALRR